MTHCIQAISDNALRIEWSANVSLGLNDRIIRFCSHLQTRCIPGVVEWVPSYKSVTIYYLPHVITLDEISKDVEDILQMSESAKSDQHKHRTVFVPVYYGGQTGLDLERLARIHHMTVNEVVRRHQEPLYVVYMLGFLPGFPYLGGLDESIATPRLETARQNTPRGSVGIAHHQTGIYPTTSPGGWNIIGKTPFSLVDLTKQHPFLFQTGDYVRFYKVTNEEYDIIEYEMEAGTYNLDKYIEHA